MRQSIWIMNQKRWEKSSENIQINCWRFFQTRIIRHKYEKWYSQLIEEYRNNRKNWTLRRDLCFGKLFYMFFEHKSIFRTKKSNCTPRWLRGNFYKHLRVHMRPQSLAQSRKNEPPEKKSPPIDFRFWL